MIPSERKIGAGDADQGSTDDIEPVMVEVEESRGTDVECHSDRDESDSDQMVRRRGCKLAQRHLAAIRGGRRRVGGSSALVKRELVDCIGGASCEGEAVCWQVWDDDGEFGAEEECQV